LFEIIFKTNNNEIFKITENLQSSENIINYNFDIKTPHLFTDILCSNTNNNTQILNDLLFNSTFGIDTIDNTDNTEDTILNIGTNNANIINIGTGVLAQIINIGAIGDIVNIQGSLNYIQSSNLQVANKNIYLNEGSTQLSSARFSGIIIKDGNIDPDILNPSSLLTSGYILISNTGNFYNIKAPENNYILSTPILYKNSNILIDEGN
jgi:hypothetical protein